MPLISTLGNAGSQSFGSRGIVTGGSGYINDLGDRWTFPLSTAFSYGTGNFTIECWVYPTLFTGSARIIWRQANNIYLGTYPSGQLFWYNGVNVIVGGVLTLNAWNHIAVVRNANSTRVFLNGVRYGAVADTVNITTPITAPLIGCFSASGDYAYRGWLTNFRISKQAIYTTNFTPSLSPFTRTSQGSTTTSLLMNMRSTTAMSTDSSANNLSITNTGITYSILTPFLQPYVTPPNVVVSSATVTPSTLSVSEGSTVTFNVLGENTPNGTYYYTIEETIATGVLTSADFTGGSLSGSFSISGNTGSFPLTISRDLVTEGTESFLVYIRTGSTSGQVIGSSDEITIADTSLTPTISASAGSVDEGNSISFTASNVGPDGTYFWTILNGTTANADFGLVSGSFLVSGSSGGVDNGSGTFVVDTVSDRSTEGNQTFQVQVRTGSVSGTVVATSSSITINDTSLTPSASFINNPSIAELSGNFGSLSTSTTLRVSNLGPAGTYYWTVNNQSGTLTTSDLTSGTTSGSFTTSTFNGSADIVFTAAVDQVAETNSLQQFQIQIREGSTTGTILTTTVNSIIIYDSTVTITAVAPNPMSEGNALNITVTTPLSSISGLVPGAYWLTFESTGSATAADVFGLPYSFNITGMGNYFINGIVGAVSLDGIEGSETFRIGVRQGSTTGPLVGLSPIITINASAT